MDSVFYIAPVGRSIIAYVYSYVSCFLGCLFASIVFFTVDVIMCAFSVLDACLALLASFLMFVCIYFHVFNIRANLKVLSYVYIIICNII